MPVVTSYTPVPSRSTVTEICVSLVRRSTVALRMGRLPNHLPIAAAIAGAAGRGQRP